MSYPVTIYETKTSVGFGCPQTFRIADFQAVRPKNSLTWDIFLNGGCVDTGFLNEISARASIIKELKERIL